MKTAPYDKWGNIRIPQLKMLPGYTSQHNDWLFIPSMTDTEQYSSLIGEPISCLHPATLNLTVDFSLKTSYMSMTSAPWEKFSKRDAR
jgi:hypothetical protein